MKTSEALRDLLKVDGIPLQLTRTLPAHIESVARMEGELEAYRRDLGIFFDVPKEILAALQRLQLACTQPQSRPVDPVKANDRVKTTT